MKNRDKRTRGGTLLIMLGVLVGASTGLSLFTMKEKDVSGRAGRSVLLAAVIAAVATLGVTALLVNIFERKQEARTPF